MTRIEGLLYQLHESTDNFDFDYAELLIQKYAEWYAERFRQKLLENAWKDPYGGTYIIDEELKKIKLPDHE
jgi:C4-type Zn-finger protein